MSAYHELDKLSDPTPESARAALRVDLRSWTATTSGFAVIQLTGLMRFRYMGGRSEPSDRRRRRSEHGYCREESGRRRRREEEGEKEEEEHEEEEEEEEEEAEEEVEADE